MKQVNLDKCETANDAYLALKREKEPCFGRFNRVWIYANTETPPHENCTKIYVITHRGFELDDLGYPDLLPVRYFFTKEKRDQAFDELVARETEWFEKCKNGQYANQEDYEIGDNTNDDFLELYMDKWCYEWGKDEYEVEE